MLFSDTQRAIPGFLLITTLVAVYIGLSPAPADDWVINPLTGVTALAFCLLAFARIALGVPNRAAKRIWGGLIGVFCTVAAAQFVEPYSEALQQNFGIDDVADCVLLIVSPITLWMIAKFDPPPIMARSLFLFGFLMQSAATILDVLNASFELHWHWNVAAIDVVTDFGQFAALQTYLIGVAVFLLSLRYHRLARAGGVKKLGELSRYLLVRLNLLDGTGSGTRSYCVAGYGALLWLARFMQLLPASGPLIRDRHGRQMVDQAADIFRLGWRHGLDAGAYYRFELYHRLKYNRAGSYLTNFETSHGLFAAIDHLLANGQNAPAPDFADRFALASFCKEHDLPFMPALAIDEDGRLDHRHASPAMLDRDLLAVPRHVRKFDNWGMECTLIPVSGRGRFSELSAREAWLVFPRPDCPPDLCAIAPGALVVVQVVTCRTKQQEIRPTHGLLRLIAGLDGQPGVTARRAPAADLVHLAACIDMAEGRLGPAIPHLPGRYPARYVDHPATGAQIAGLVLSRWQEIKRLACKAHAQSPGRFVIGWDIAYKADGIAILGATGLPDVELLQSAYDEPIGDSPLAEPILDFLQILNAAPHTGR